MKHPQKSDFDTETSDGGVIVTFQPTKSIFTFHRLADPDDIAKHGSVSPHTVRHAGPTGDTGDYSEAEVQRMALSIARDAVQYHRS